MNAEEKNRDDSLDHAPCKERMAAVDAAMRHYFGSQDRIRARAQEFPCLKSR